MPIDEEKRWVERAAKEPTAFTHLYNHYFPKVYAYVNYRVGRVQDAEDIVADTFLKALQNIAKFKWQKEGSFAAWLFSIARNQIVDRYRHNRNLAELLPLEDVPEVANANLSPDEAFLQKENNIRLRQIIATLPLRRQEVITLKFLGNLRNQEIAKILGLDERTVASHLCRGLEDLQHKYLDAPLETGKGNQQNASRL
jgi:RNA polymerase sigma-70 factor (ECF subfamily)